MEKKALLVSMIGSKYNNNYGGVLQAYALQKVLESLNICSRYLDYNPNISYNNSVSMKTILTKVKNKLKNKNFKNALRNTLNKNKLRKINKERIINFERFKKTYINLTKKKYTNLKELENDNENFKKEYNYIIAGSDQIWNPSNRLEALKVYLLNFIDDICKISYASSVASYIPENLKELYKKSISKFKAISVREESSADYIFQTTGLRPEVVLDPTILLTKDDYNLILKKTEFDIKKPYIFVYDIYRSNEIIPAVNSVSKILKMKYINYYPILGIRKYFYENYLGNYYALGPSEFLWLLDNSSFIITSSFHGTVFSILFKKPFYVILPSMDRKQSGFTSNVRIVDFLAKLNLNDRIVDSPKKLKDLSFSNDINWDSVHEKLELEREKSIKFLKDALKLCEKEGLNYETSN